MYIAKKLLLIAAGAGIIASLAFTANAQLVPYTGTSTAPSSTVVNATTTTSSTDLTSNDTTSPATTSDTSGFVLGASTTDTSTASGGGSTLAPIGPIYVNQPATTQIPSPAVGSWIQFDGLIVTGTEGNTAPTQITAGNPNAVCELFETQDSVLGMAEACPQPTTASSTGIPYNVVITDATTLLLRDRTSAVIPNITPGDEINVFGFYTPDGTIEAAIVRDLSKPQIGILPTTGLTTSGTTTVSGLSPVLSSLFPNLTSAEINSLSSMSATITQINSDGSFVVQLSNGQTFTVPNFIRVGESISFSQIVNWLNNQLQQNAAMMNTASTSAAATSTSAPMIPATLY